MSYRIKLKQGIDKFVLVGCGGTGSLLAEGLCRLLMPYAKPNFPIILIDYDRVEPPNLLRQNYFPSDIGKFKSQVLAERLSRLYGRRIVYSVYPFSKDVLDGDVGGGMRTQGLMNSLIIGCVDSHLARKEIADSAKKHFNTWWLDAGNSYNSGQVLLGNKFDREGLSNSFNEEEMTIDALPLPSFQLPALLLPPNTPKKQDCAEAIAEQEQSPVINQAMSTLLLQMIFELLGGKLTYMGIYLDLGAGSMVTIPNEPKMIARMLSMSEDTLMLKTSHICAMSRMSREQLRRR